MATIFLILSLGLYFAGFLCWWRGHCLFLAAERERDEAVNEHNAAEWYWARAREESRADWE